MAGEAWIPKAPPQCDWWHRGVPVMADAKMILTGKTPTAQDQAVIVFLSYGPKIPPMGGHILSRRLALSTADIGADAWALIGNITDLPDDRKYRVHAARGYSEDTIATSKALAIKIESASFGGMELMAPAVVDKSGEPFYFKDDSQIVNGWQTVKVYGYNGNAEKMAAYVWFEDYGKADPRPSSMEGSAGAAADHGPKTTPYSGSIGGRPVSGQAIGNIIRTIGGLAR